VLPWLNTKQIALAKREIPEKSKGKSWPKKTEKKK